MSIVLFLATGLANATPTLPPRGHDALAARLLAVHNQARAEVGAPPLVWDEELARSAAQHGPRLGALGRLVHSEKAERPGQSENLSMDLDWRGTPESLAGMWVEEKALFKPGAFPDNSRTGYWKDVGHYTTMIWKTTTKVGCALHDEGGWRYLICRYSPKANQDGKLVP